MSDAPTLTASEEGEVIILVDQDRLADGPSKLPAEPGSTTVPLVAYSPLTPAAKCELWVVGVNSCGEGPASNKVSFQA